MAEMELGESPRSRAASVKSAQSKKSLASRLKLSLSRRPSFGRKSSKSRTSGRAGNGLGTPLEPKFEDETIATATDHRTDGDANAYVAYGTGVEVSIASSHS